MIPTRPALSKASRLPLTSKHGNKDYYKGNRVSALPGGPRTGAPGRHVVRGKAKYRLVDEQVRVYVAPPISVLNSTPLKPYVTTKLRLTEEQKTEFTGKFPPEGFTGQHYLDMYRALNPAQPEDLTWAEGGEGEGGEGEKSVEERMRELSLYEEEPGAGAGAVSGVKGKGEGKEEGKRVV